MVSNSEFYVAILCILQFRQMAKFLPFSRIFTSFTILSTNQNFQKNFNFGPKRIIRGPLKFLFSEQQRTIVKSKHSKKCVSKIKTFYAFVEALKSCSFHIGSAFATVRISGLSVVCKPHCLKENNRNIVFKSELVSAGHLRHF